GLSVSIGALDGTGLVTSSIPGAVILTLGEGSVATFSGVIQDGSGILALNIAGDDLETLSGANTYSGGTTIGPGATLRISSDANLGAVPASATPGSINLNGGELWTTASFALNAKRGIHLGSFGGSFKLASTLTYNGIVAGPGALRVTFGGTLVLGGSNT